jgi:uncharacterized membrane protein YsdA (DUF1294 family)
MLTPQYILMYYLATINVVAYLLMVFDKYLARNNRSRIAERNLFLLAVFAGAFGIYLGMKAPIYHKAGKQKFKWVIPVLLIINLVLIICFFKYLRPYLCTSIK